MNEYLAVSNNSICATNEAKKEAGGIRYIKNTPYNSELEEFKMSVRIAKWNFNIDTGNKYYREQLEKAEIRLKNHPKSQK